MSKTFNTIIVGGGAAGIFAAINLKKINPNLSVAVLEKSTKLLSKVKVSGGGRCNVTHACFDVKELVKFYPRGQRELIGPFSSFNPTNTIEWFSERNVQLKTEEDGRMFPTTDNSQTIIDCFLADLKKYKVEVIFQTKVESITKDKETFDLTTTDQIYHCTNCVITTGGFNKLEQYDFIQNLGIDIEAPTPSLFTFNLPNHEILKLQGVVSNVSIRLNGTKLQESGPLLITHWGVSGPAVLKLSSWAARFLHDKNYEFEFRVNWLEGKKEDELKAFFQTEKQNYGAKKVINQFNVNLPKKLQLYLLEKSEIDTEIKWADVNKKQLNKLVNNLLNDVYQSKGKTTFKQEFVSCGGVKLNEINFKTMESKKVENLYFAGEVLDIDALTGGFNFQAAWTTSWLAAQSIAS
ncbi:MAG: NAD(P)/FAD-dependent oxidoreductase [Flavobacteriales bacterium]|nr:NAD(P)/FAD-dependent oxidoreductase [Flavobacteriales bacterium]MCB9363280.1 NAD(P)/FAD-dependent oxidoreductase [Flavobacteriales bacterium]